VKEKLIIFYDADCGFCQWCLDWLRKRLIQENDLKFIAYQATDVKTNFPQISMEHSNRGIQSLDKKGLVDKNEKAVALCLGYTKNWHWLGNIILFPFFRPIFALGYRIVASNRQRLSKLIGKKSCTIPY
jgi:predicted DCC family thiol-disulfide oxidoreductase YuxK